mgnify:CR=1 FL=1
MECTICDACGGADHFQIAQGDSDVTDIRDVMTRGAMLFEESAFKYAGSVETRSYLHRSSSRLYG